MTFTATSIFLTPEDVARRLHLQVNTVRIYLRTGKIKGVHMSRKWLIPEEALVEFMNTGLTPPTKDTAGPSTDVQA